MVKLLQNKFGVVYFCTVLDTCHARISSQFITSMKMLYNNFNIKNYTLEDYFKINMETIGIIHLSKTVKNGYRKGRHGQPFDGSLEDLYKKYCNNCAVVLEVAEDDYDLSLGFAESIKSLKQVMIE